MPKRSVHAVPGRKAMRTNAITIKAATDAHEQPPPARATGSRPSGKSSRSASPEQAEAGTRPRPASHDGPSLPAASPGRRRASLSTPVADRRGRQQMPDDADAKQPADRVAAVSPERSAPTDRRTPRRRSRRRTADRVPAMASRVGRARRARATTPASPDCEPATALRRPYRRRAQARARHRGASGSRSQSETWAGCMCRATTVLSSASAPRGRPGRAGGPRTPRACAAASYLRR